MSNRSIMSDYETIRNEHRDNLTRKKSQLYAAFPRLKEIEDEMIRLGIEASRSILFSDGDKKACLEELEDRQYLLKNERFRLLAQGGFPKNYLELEYTCPLCKDTGFVDLQPCSCYKQKAISLAYRQSNLKQILKQQNFEYFNFQYYSDVKDAKGFSPRLNMQRIHRECINYVSDFDEQKENLLFIGKPGLGKTFMSHCMAKDLLDNGKNVIYQLCSDLIDIIRHNKFDFEKEEQYNQTMKSLYECDFLIIDDLGTESQSNFSYQVIYDILNKRIMNEKRMLLITNLDMQDLFQYSERIYSRILGNFRMHEFIGEDIRLKKNQVI